MRALRHKQQTPAGQPISWWQGQSFRIETKAGLITQAHYADRPCHLSPLTPDT